MNDLRRRLLRGGGKSLEEIAYRVVRSDSSRRLAFRWVERLMMRDGRNGRWWADDPPGVQYDRRVLGQMTASS